MAFDKNKFVADLKDAKAVALKVAAKEKDGGSCNLDDLLFNPPRGMREETLKSLATEAGLHGFVTRRRSGSSRIFLIGPPGGGQGFKRTAQVEAMCELMRTRGWDVSIWYQMD